MTPFEEIKIKKKRAEDRILNNINAAIFDFEQDTGCAVHNIDICFQSVRPIGSFLSRGKGLTRGNLVSEVYKIPCSCGKFILVELTNNLLKDLVSIVTP